MNIVKIIVVICFALLPLHSSAQIDKVNERNKAKDTEFINGMAELMAYSLRTPILRTPDQYGMAYEDIFFPAIDGVPLEGWFIPAKNSNKLIITNHPMPANRYGYAGHLDPYKIFGGFEVNFLPEYKTLHDAGYNIIPDKKEMISLIQNGVEKGVTFSDTAEVYGPYINEKLVGEALEPFKGQVTIATKFGFELAAGGKWSELNSRPENIRRVAEESLKS